MLDDTALTRAKAALRSGDRETAHPLLLELTEAQPDRADAWLWLAAASTDTDCKRTCLERALHLSPGDSRAIAALRALGHAPPTAIADDSPTASVTRHASPALACVDRDDSQPAALPALRSTPHLPANDLLAPPRFSNTGVRARRFTWRIRALLTTSLALVFRGT